MRRDGASSGHDFSTASGVVRLGESNPPTAVPALPRKRPRSWVPALFRPATAQRAFWAARMKLTESTYRLVILLTRPTTERLRSNRKAAGKAAQKAA